MNHVYIDGTKLEANAQKYTWVWKKICIRGGNNQLQGRSPVHRELNPEITNTHVIRYNGVLYDITRVDTFEGYKEDITLYCKRQARQN